MKFHKGLPVYNRLIVFALSIVLGSLGIDRIYLKEYMSGLLKFATFGGFGIWYFIDIFHIAIGKKIGSGNYYWTCELPQTKSCKEESDAIRKYLLYIVVILFIFFMYFYPKTESSLVLKKDDPFEKKENN